MKYAIIISSKDPAGLTIKNQLIKDQGFVSTEQTFEGEVIFLHKETGTFLYTISSETIHAEHLDKHIEAEAFIFATKHQSAKGVSCFCVHAPGNFSTADAGGTLGKLCKTMSPEMKRAYQLLCIDTPQNLPVMQEATHHGPDLDIPAMFVEIGSDDFAWKNTEFGAHIAKVIVKLLHEKINNTIPACKEHVVIGGLHYNYVADKLNKSKDYCVGHICPKYHMLHLDERSIDELILTSVSGKKVIFIFDWKGANNAETRSRIISILEEKNVAWVRSDQYFKE